MVDAALGASNVVGRGLTEVRVPPPPEKRRSAGVCGARKIDSEFRPVQI